jgi:hypothetical protein
MHNFTNVEVPITSPPGIFPKPVLTRPQFKQYAPPTLGERATTHSNNPSLYEARNTSLATCRMTSNYNLLEFIARRTWPAASLHWLEKVLHLSSAMLEYVDEPPNLKAVINAGKELKALATQKLLPKCVSAMGDGGICLTWPLDNFYAGLSCYNDGDIILNYRVRGCEGVRVIAPSPQDLSIFATTMRKCK